MSILKALTFAVAGIGLVSAVSLISATILFGKWWER